MEMQILEMESYALHPFFSGSLPVPFHGSHSVLGEIHAATVISGVFIRQSTRCRRAVR